MLRALSVQQFSIGEAVDARELALVVG